jgi:hypothetical protein
MTETKVTYQQIEEATSELATPLVREWYEKKDQIARSREAIEWSGAEMLSEQQRQQAIAQQKAARAAAEAGPLQERFEELMREHADAVSRLRSDLHKENFVVESTEYRSQVAFATDEVLESAMSYAQQQGDRDLAKAVFGAAKDRGHVVLVNRYLHEVAPEAREAYEELQSLPSDEELEARVANAAQIFEAPTPADYIPILGHGA